MTRPAFKSTLEKTFGDMQVGSQGSLTVSYKDIVLIIDPVDVPKVEGDYLLLTNARFHISLQMTFRKNIKTICPPDFAKPGTVLEIEIRNQRAPAVVVAKPIYKKGA